MKWAVLVVHGVGDTGPGVTVDRFVSALAAASPTFQPDGRVEVHYLRDPKPQAAEAAPRSAKRQEAEHRATHDDGDVPVFPMHVRRACQGASKDGKAYDVVLGEVYWSDLSTIREGLPYLLLSLLTTIFSLRYVADQAAAVPGRLAALARWTIFVSSWILCAPIAGLNAFLVLTIGSYYWVIVPLKKGWPGADPVWIDRAGMHCLGLLAALAGIVAWRRCGTNNWGTTWTRFWSAFAFVGLAVLTVLLLRDFSWLSDTAWKHLTMAFRTRSTVDPKYWAGIPEYIAANLVLIEMTFFVLGLLVALSLLLGGIVQALNPDRYGSSFEAAHSALLAQVGAWVLVIPTLAILGIHAFLPTESPPAAQASVPGTTAVSPAIAQAPARLTDDLLRSVRETLAIHLFGACIIGMVAWIVWLRRDRWVRKNGPAYPFPPARPRIPRLVVSGRIVLALTAVSLSATVLFMSDFWRGRPEPLKSSYAGMAEALIGAFVAIIGVASALLAQGLREGLHILMDVVNHFYRRWEKVPWRESIDNPSAADLVALDPRDFEIQHWIEERFRAALKKLLSEPGITHLTVVSHSQGTMVAVDVLSLSGMEPAERNEFRELLQPLNLHLVTMGSPFTHLYQHYFRFRYPSLAHPSWADLRGIVTHWINVFRVDDFVGTYIETGDPALHRPRDQAAWKKVGTWKGAPENRQLGPGGHTQYWRGLDVARLLQVEQAVPV